MTGAVIAALVVAVVPVGQLLQDRSPLRGATVRASSTARGFSPGAVLAESGEGWRSRTAAVGAWLEVSWVDPRLLRSVSIEQPATDPAITAGYLEFSDGSTEQVEFSGRTRARVAITPRTVGAVRFVVGAVDSGARYVTVRSIRLNEDDRAVDQDPRGEASMTARATASTGGDASGLGPGGSGWSTGSPVGTTLRWSWTSPRELVALTVAGSSDSNATITRATLRFDDGARLTLGAVRAARASPTVMAFMARSTSSVTLRIDAVQGDGPLRLAAVRFREHGFDAAPLPSQPGPVVEAPSAACAASDDTGPIADLQVRCPENGARVGDVLPLQVLLPFTATGARAVAWAAEGRATSGPAQVEGAVSVDLQLRLDALPPGPITVIVSSLGPSPEVVHLQLLHGTAASERESTSRAAAGRTLVWDEEFDGPVSVSRTDSQARYFAGKPEHWGGTDFGDAIFADPSAGFGNIGVLDERYLRMTVQPRPAAFLDPQGWNRNWIGAIAASAHPGGAGFSAQYGYFEARMKVPASPGTWPAFWMLPSTNLIAAQHIVAEVDAVELYGQDPTGACQTTHSYADGGNDGVAHCGQRFPSDRVASQWHMYGVDVRPDRIMFFIDGEIVAQAPQVAGGGDPMFFLVDLALGGGWPVRLDGTMGRAQVLVDSVRVYV